MPTTHKAKYPVVDPEPTFSRALLNFNLTDILTVGAFTGAGYGFGWFGARKPLRVPNSRFVAGIGLLAGCSFAALSSMQRLMGLEPNDREVAVYGALSSAELEKRNRDASIPNVQLIDSSANHD